MATPHVIVIDDDPAQELFVAALVARGVTSELLGPDEVTQAKLESAALIVIDEYLEDWPGRDRSSLPLALRVPDGLALAGVLRAVLDRRGNMDVEPQPSPTSIVLRTANLQRLADGLPRALWERAVASRHDLELVVGKSTRSPRDVDIADQVVSLANAIGALPSSWTGAGDEEVLTWLGLPADVTWRADAIWQIEQCRPPWSALSSVTAGREWVRWFLQRIVPFATFLVDDLTAATQLGVTGESFAGAIDSHGALNDLLTAARYEGQLNQVEGRRWWRAGLASFVKEKSGSSPSRKARDVGGMVAALDNRLSPLELDNPVLTIDGDYFTNSRPVEITAAVRLQPDGWPTYANDPWLATDRIDVEPELAKLVILEDRSAPLDGSAE